MSKKNYLALLSLLILGGCEEPTSIERIYKESVSIKSCWFDVEEDWPELECGVLTVPENYSKPEGRKIQLPFIIVKSREPSAETVPLVVAGGGGPGGSIGIAEEENYNFGSAQWADWPSSTDAAGRDLILVDNRGVGSSIPKLDCPSMIKEDLASLAIVRTMEEQKAFTRKSYATCKNELEARGIDLSQYHVVNAAKDLEELRIGLDYAQFNLYGISYGTRVSLEYERLYSNSVRAMILDGVYPQYVKSLETDARYSSQAISRVLNKCKADLRCSEEFGYDLDVRLEKFLKTLSEKAILITVTNPASYKPIQVAVTPDVFFDTIFSMAYSGSGISIMPKFLHATFNGNNDYLTEYVREYYVDSLADKTSADGAYTSYTCYDEVPFNDFSKSKNEISKYPFQQYSTKWTLQTVQIMCDVWDVPAANNSFKTSYKIDTPTLIYSGEFDPVTPSAMTKRLIRSASSSWQLVWPNIAHGVMAISTCSDWVAQEFLNNPTEDPFAFDCNSAITRFRFRL